MTDTLADQEAYAAAERLLGVPLVLPLGPGEPEVGVVDRVKDPDHDRHAHADPGPEGKLAEDRPAAGSLAATHLRSPSRCDST